MSQITATSNQIELSGVFTFENIAKLEVDLIKALQKVDKFAKIDLKEVKSCDSSLLALIMVMVNYAKKHSINIKKKGARSLSVPAVSSHLWYIMRMYIKKKI